MPVIMLITGKKTIASISMTKVALFVDVCKLSSKNQKFSFPNPVPPNSPQS